MIGEFKEAKRDQNGDLCVTFIVDDDTNIEKLNQMKGMDLLIKYEKFTGKKTSKQNRYFWELMRGLSKALHVKQWTAYLMILDGYGVWSDVSVPEESVDDFRSCLEESYRLIKKMNDSFDGRVTLRCYKGLHKYTKEEARYLIDCAAQEAKDQGIEVLPPYEVNRLFKE